jgi:hypothetical protein
MRTLNPVLAVVGEIMAIAAWTTIQPERYKNGFIPTAKGCFLRWKKTRTGFVTLTGWVSGIPDHVAAILPAELWPSLLVSFPVTSYNVASPTVPITNYVSIYPDPSAKNTALLAGLAAQPGGAVLVEGAGAASFINCSYYSD